MKLCSSCKQTKSLSEFRKDKCTKDGLRGQCKECLRKRDRANYRKNKSKILARQKDKYKINRKKKIKYQKEYAELNKEKIKSYLQEYNLKNKDKLKAQAHNNYLKRKSKPDFTVKQKEYRISYYSKNKEKIKEYQRNYRKTPIGQAKKAALTAKRRAKLKKATPKWVDSDHLKKIQSFYIESRKLTERTGIPHEVDHIIPLQGLEASGLHVWWNLQIITADDNRKKSNIIYLEL